MSTRLRILLTADQCNPEWSSLPGVAFRAAEALSRVADVTLATHIRNKPALDKTGCGDAKIVYIDNEAVARPMYRLGCLLRGGNAAGWTTHMAFMYPPYIAFERKIYKHFRKDLKQGKFDLVHRLTPMSPTLPSPLAKWSPVPFVIGPLNGGLRWPAGYFSQLSREREWATYIRRACRFLPYYRSTFRKSAAVLAACDHTIADLPKSAEPHTIAFPEVGIDPAKFRLRDDTPATGDKPCVFVYVGRLVALKCVDVLIEAMARSEELRKHKLWLIGDGPDREKLEALSERLGVTDVVEFHGQQPHERVGELLRSSDVFAFPSIRELGGGVVVEAMATGLPCMVVDYGGPGWLVREGRGVKLPLVHRDKLLDRCEQEMIALANDPEKRRAFGAAGADYAHRLMSWDAKARKMVEIYEWVLGQRPERPEFEPTSPGVSTPEAAQGDAVSHKAAVA